MTGRGAFNLPVSVSGTGDEAIARAATGVAAFVGRTLKGPLHQPVRITGFSEFHTHFGGLWQPSTLSYAIEQYFENGGREALIVRIANGARAPSLSLPGPAGPLLLLGLNPGSREYLRAAVDYDGIDESEPERFNLVVQRLRVPGSQLIEDQEIFRRVSIAGGVRYVGDVLLESRLVRLAAAPPPARPDPTASGAPGAVVGYVSANPDGYDGVALSDYDVIGSAARGTGLFALTPDHAFDLLCIPSLAREQDVGLATLLVATRFCRERHAMLLVDPPAHWSSASAALDEMRRWPFRSDDAVMFFPRILGFDRLRNRPEVFGSAAAAAGMLARADAGCPVWAPAEGEEPLLRPAYRPATPVSEGERHKLAHAGINTLYATRSATRAPLALCTLAAGASASAQGKFLAARRLELFICASIERGVRWLAGAPNLPEARSRAQAQVERFLADLDAEGAFGGSRPEESYFAICDERVNGPDVIAAGAVQLLFGVAPVRPAEFNAWLLTFQSGRPRMRPIAVNRLATSQQRVEWEIESSILG